MNKIIIIFFLIFVIGSLAAQKTVVEITNVSKPAEDARINSDTIPKVYPINTEFKDVMILRFKYQTDLLTGLDSILKQRKIRNAVILSGIGSVQGYHYHVVSNRNFPTSNIFVKDPTSPADIASMNGYVINGRVHAHITFSNADKAFGGHLEPGTEVFTFAIVTIGILNEGADLNRVDDKNYR